VLRFVCVRVGGDAGEGLRGQRTQPSVSLEEAIAECAAAGAGARVWIVDGGPAESGMWDSSAVLNVGPSGYLPPEPIAAAGGYVVRRTPAGIDLLLIHRRGAWDLPKGKLDAGESPEAGALREVAEEVGIAPRRLRLGPSLGTTLHGYPHPRRSTYAVKTTHWFAMTADDTVFSPQSEEGIDKVEWVPWHEAGERLDFATLRDHHAGVDTAMLGL
jgi:8-oxo-dGTP pyrophosphatase MutT (NUDIX family)